jgi:phenylacetate-CoA ligase
VHPVAVRRLLLPLHERLLGRRTLACLAAMEASQWWPVECLRELQSAKLRALLAHAAARCPFQRRRLEAAAIDPRAASLGDLARLPPIGKQETTRHLGEMIDRSIPGGLHACTTGGSTGRPLAFFLDRTRQAADQAARARSRRWFGIEPGEREAYLWGSPLEQTHADRARRLRDRLMNHLLLNAFCMTPAVMSSYLARLRRFDPVHLFGYPSSLARLLRHARETGHAPRNRSLRAVFVTGEVLCPADRALIEEMTAVPVADGYGSREGGFIAHQCPAGRYHVTMESLIVETLDAHGGPTTDGESGEIVVTHLDALGMPFIRYRTGDLGRRSSAPCPCGRGLEVLEIIEGRRTDMLRRADGGYAHALSVIYILRDEPGVEEFKVTQQPDRAIDVRVVPRPSFDAAAGKRLAERIERSLGGGLRVGVNPVAEIPPDPSGKHRYVVSLAG